MTEKYDMCGGWDVCSNANQPLWINKKVWFVLDGKHMILCYVLLLVLYSRSFYSVPILISVLYLPLTPEKLEGTNMHRYVQAKFKSSSTSLLELNQQAADIHCNKNNRGTVIDKWAHLFNGVAVFNASSTAYSHPIISIPWPQSDIFFWDSVVYSTLLFHPLFTRGNVSICEGRGGR